jgi:hypothetical protein
MKKFLLGLVLCLGLASVADAQLLRRNRSTATPAPVAVPAVAAEPVAAPTAVKSHPVVTLFVRQHIIAGLVEKGMPRAKARKIVDDQLTDEFLTASLAEKGLKTPMAGAGGGGVFQWLIDNLPAILALITQLISLFGGL